MQLRLLVVLYNCLPSKSSTLLSLSEISFDYIDQIELIVINNGPNMFGDCLALESLQRKYNTSIVQQLDNLSLSVLYNRYTPSDCSYMLLDQDTILTEEYMNDLLCFDNSSAGIYLPKICCDNKTVYPKGNRELLAIDSVCQTRVISVTSGLCIKKTVIDKLEYKYSQLFDERFSFYGIDSTFFYHLWAIEDVDFYLGVKIEHDLTSVLSLAVIEEWRYKERLVDVVLQLRCFFGWQKIKNLIIFCKKSPKIKLIKNLHLMFFCFFKAKHPYWNNGLNKK